MGPETARSTQKFLSRVLFGCIGGKDALQKFVTIDFDVAHRVVRHPGVEFRFGSRCTWTTTPLSPGVAAADGTDNQTNLRLQNVFSAILRTPDIPCATNPNAGKVGIFIMHSFSSYTGFTACTELAKRGYVTLCADSVFTNRQQ